MLDRDDAGRVESIAFPNGVTEAYTYDSAGRPLTVTVADGASELASFEVTRDDAGRIATFLDSLDGGTRSGEFDYDAGGRLAGSEGTAGAESWAATYDLDPAGNRETVSGDGAVDASFNSLDQLVSAGDVAYSYDDSGFLTSFTGVEGATELSWSADGELLGSDGPGGAVSYEYDPAGVLVSRTDDAGTVGFVNDASQSLPHAVAASDGSWWVYAGARPLAQATPDGGVHYLHADARGDVRVATDAAGSVTDTFSYSVDGEVTTRTGTTPVSVGWNGEYSDPDTGMVWLRARWFDPVLARFISADPWHGDPSVPVSLNRYLYANADPVNNTDPTGLTTLLEQREVMAAQSALYSIRGMSVSRANFIIQAALDATVAITAATFVAVQMFGADDPNDQDGIDGPRVEDHAPEAQTDRAGGGSDSGGAGPPVNVGNCMFPAEPEDSHDKLYRGVDSSHHAYQEATSGQAWPGDILGHADGMAHNYGDTTTSRLTSWTNSYRQAAEFASSEGNCGVILEIDRDGVAERALESPDRFGEREVLVPGLVTGARVIWPM